MNGFFAMTVDRIGTLRGLVAAARGHHLDVGRASPRW